ncbi:alpha/beta fold hydrolase [Actibacterium pelagium]|uniref:Esterase n=1 Tax=Actibacterium pelagium TaxID=2029103 RepID=A0A917EMN0_9RHOB|nr:alpha/beta hydrolase [Actibacterium pelagium]GGE60928.1 esterase [Actibacterium pelagium]
MAERIVLVHGAWGSSLSWGPLTRALRRAGYDVTALDMPGHGDDPTPPEEVTLDDYIDRVVEELESGPPALLVGHSMGGMAVSGAAERAAPHVRKLAYISAFLPRHGDSLLDLMRMFPNNMTDVLLPGPVDGTTLLDPMPAMALLAHDASETMQAQIAAYLQVQPNSPQTDVISLGKAFESVPKAYVTCLQDRTIPTELQTWMQDAHGVTERYEMDCGHLPMMTQPNQLIEILKGL